MSLRLVLLVLVGPGHMTRLYFFGFMVIQRCHSCFKAGYFGGLLLGAYSWSIHDCSGYFGAQESKGVPRS